MKNKELIEFLLDSILPTVARILFDGLVLFTMGLIILALLKYLLLWKKLKLKKEV